MRPTAIWRHGEWIPTDVMTPNGIPTLSSGEQTKGPAVISDRMPGGVNGLVHPCNNRRYDSKSRFRDETRARGCTEVGNDSWPAAEPVRNSNPAPEIKRYIDTVTPMSKSEHREFLRRQQVEHAGRDARSYDD